ncbi:MAG: glycosyltransferase family 4 protein [Candidatus Falkowbacteria bacterium]|nr:glycosyltransferase family 4 protein [Candidatus Falkowbacteria bacterium]
MKVAFIHNEKKAGTGAAYINDLICLKLKKHGVKVKNFYPTTNLLGKNVHLSDPPVQLRGLSNILFFFSLLEHRKEILTYDLIQGTTYTPLTFLAYDIPVISHFGSTTKGFLDMTPQTNKLEPNLQKFWEMLKCKGALKEIQLKTRRPLRDVAEIEKLVASRSDAVIASSKKVRHEIISLGTKPANISVIHNAIEDFWFAKPLPKIISKPSLIFIGRLGNGVFDLKLKGLDRIWDWYKHFPLENKTTIAITTNEALTDILTMGIPRHRVLANYDKTLIPELFDSLTGSIVFISSRYEGFSLSLIEAMSRGMVPLSYPVGVAPEIIINGQNGFLVKNQREVISYTKLLLENNALRKKMSLAAYETAQQFTADKMIEQFIDLYKKILN